MSFLKNLGLCVLSALLLIISYPQIEIWQLAWVALVPLLFLISRERFQTVPHKAFLWALFWGFLVYFGTLGWLVYVTYPGAILLSLYLGLYAGFFAIGFIHFQKLPLIPRVFVLASLWTLLEIIRSNLFTGFGWITLGHSQYKNLLFIQITDVVGLYGISFMVILVNLVVFESIKMAVKTTQEAGSLRKLQLIVLAMLLFILGHGLWVFKTTQFKTTIRVAVVQPNIPQEIKWDERFMPEIVTKTLKLTDQTARDNPNIILWPETSLPGILSEQPAYVQQIQLKAMDLKTPIMMGAIIQEHNRYYNSAILIGADGKIQERYNKIHLVPFGEFLPLRPVLGWLNRYIGLEDFSSGTKYTLFEGPEKHKYGVLICFEDALDYLWRNFTRAGGEFFVNMTNDAWFKDTKEPFVHLQCAVMQAVANKRSLVRAANTGVSGFVDPLGRIIDLAHNAKGKKTFVEATASADIPLNNKLTFYTKFPSLFTYLYFVCILWGVWLLRRQRG